MPDALDHYTRTAADDYAWFFRSKFFLEDCFNCSKIIRINNLNAVYTQGTAEGFKVNLACRISVKVLSCSRILLMSRHACNGIIKNDYRRI